MTFPTEIFPDDRTDPTVKPQNEMSVEDTLGIVNHLKGVTRKRRATNWRYLVVTEGETPESAAERVRDIYELPPTAPVEHQGTEWAVWASDGPPTYPAFEVEEEDPVIAAVIAAAPPGTVLQEPRTMLQEPKAVPAREDPVVAEAVAKNRAAYEKARSERIAKVMTDDSKETWAYSTDIGESHVKFRARFGAHPEASVDIHPVGDIAAVWLGKGAPTRPAFPRAQPAPPGLKVLGVQEDEIPTSAMEERVLSTPPGSVRRVVNGKVTWVKPEEASAPNGRFVDPALDNSPTVHAGYLPESVESVEARLPRKEDRVVLPEVSLHNMGLKLYGMSRDPGFTESMRGFILRVSDMFHAEAAKLETARVRAIFDKKK